LCHASPPLALILPAKKGYDFMRLLRYEITRVYT
jgi:hypothetical protein